MTPLLEMPVTSPPIERRFTKVEEPVAPVLTAVDVLYEVAEVIRQRGWCRGSFMNRRGKVCVVGAFRIVERRLADPEVDIDSLAREAWTREQVKTPATLRARELLLTQIRKEHGGMAIPNWNDGTFMLFGGRRVRRTIVRAAEAA